MTITGQSALGKDEIDKMVRDAESHEADDRKRREEAETRNNADNLVYQTKKLLSEQQDKLQGEERENVSAKLSTLEKALEGSDIDRIKEATEELVTASHTFTQRLYEEASRQAQAQGAGYDGSSSPDTATVAPGDEEVVDAEIVDEGGA